MPYKLFRYIFLITICTSLFTDSAAASDYFFKRISIEQGLSHPGVNSILRDYNGVLWIGTRQGLNRVNRDDLKIYFHDDNNSQSIPGNCIFNLHEDEQQNLWVVTDGGLSLYNRDEDNFETKITSRIQSIANIKSGVLFGGYSSIYFYSYETKELQRLPLLNDDPDKDTTYKDYFISRLVPLNDSIVLAGTEGDGIFVYNLLTHHFTPHITTNVSPLQTIFYDQQSQEIYVSVFQSGLYCYDLSGKQKKHYATQNSELTNDIILDIIKHNDKIWLATDGNGVDILDPATGKFTNIQHIPGDINSLPVNSITVFIIILV